MKKSIKLTLGLLGISAISAITVGSVISCSNDSSMVSTNSNNSSNSNNTNKSSSTNPNSSNDTSFIPYSELTKTVTKEPSFAAALANWTNKWNQLTANPKTYLALITNDFNACLSDTTEFFNAHSNSKDNWLTNCYDWICSESYSNVQISLNKNNTFNISYDSICYIGYIKNKISYQQVIKITSENNYTNLTFKPYIYCIPDMNYSGSLLTGGLSSNMYAGEYITTGVYKYIPTVTILSKTYFSNAPKQTFPNWLENEKNKTLNTTDNSPNAGQNFFPGNVAHIEIYIFNPYFPMLVSSYQNGMNFGELSSPNNN